MRNTTSHKPRLHPIAWLNQPGFIGETLNPIRARDNRGKVGWHCEQVSAGCEHCYAEALNQRFGNKLFYTRANREHTTPFLDEATLNKPLHWKQPRAIFWGDMSDLFGAWVPDAWLDRMFAVMASTSQHRHLLLTKRPERMAKYLASVSERGNLAGSAYYARMREHFERYKQEFTEGYSLPGAPTPELRVLYDSAAAQEQRPLRPEGTTLCNGFSGGEYHWRPWPLGNVWLGTSVENQTVADKRIPSLLNCPAAVRYLSCEPLLGELDLGKGLYSEHDRAGMDSQYLSPIDGNSTARIDWVIVGGESGTDARPMHPAWVRSLRDQCEEAGTPFYFKQWGEWLEDTGQVDSKGRDPWPHSWISDAGHEWNCHNIGRIRVRRMGRKAAGRELDRREWSEFPGVQP